MAELEITIQAMDQSVRIAAEAKQAEIEQINQHFKSQLDE
jgi:hypothetical protein